MANRKKEVYKPKPMTEGKRNLIQGLLQEYDIQSAEDIQDARKDLLSKTMFVITPFIVFEKEQIVLFDKGLYDGKLVNFELFVFGRERIIKSPLLERDISANEVDQPAVLLIKVLNNRK